MIPRWRAAVLRGRFRFGRVAGFSRPPVLAVALTVLTGTVSVAGLAWSLRHERMPGWAGSGVALWLGALLATWWSPLFAVGVLGSALDRAVARTRSAARTVGAIIASVAVAAVLIAARNIHGPALAVGTLAGAVVAGLRS